MIHLLKVLVKKIAKQSNITVIPCLLIYFSLDRLLLYLIFLNFACDKQYVLGTISIINVMKPTNLLLFPIIILCSFTSVKEIPPYKNPALPVDERVKDLLGRMTIEEKFWQTYMMPGDLDKGKDRFSHGIFGFQVSTIGTSNPELKQLLQYNPKLTAKEMAKKINEIQRYFVEETPTGHTDYCIRRGFTRIDSWWCHGVPPIHRIGRHIRYGLSTPSLPCYRHGNENTWYPTNTIARG